jgi:hypothetical protein
MIWMAKSTAWEGDKIACEAGSAATYKVAKSVNFITVQYLMDCATTPETLDQFSQNASDDLSDDGGCFISLSSEDGARM